MKKFIQYSISFIAVASIIGLSGFKLYSNKILKEEEIKMASISSKAIPVKSEKVYSKNILNNIESSGILMPKTSLFVLSEAQGRIVNMNKTKGDKVQKGDIILNVENSVLKSQKEVAQANYNSIKKDLERFENLIEKNAVTQKQVQDLKVAFENAKANLQKIEKAYEDTYIKSPIDGIINVNNLEIGQFISGGMPVCEIVNLDELKTTILLSESDIIDLQIGQKVNVFPKVLKETELEGEISFISFKAGQGLKYPVEVIIKNHPENVKAGMFVNTVIPLEDSNKILCINKKAIIGSFLNPKVFRIENDQVIKREIIIGQIFENDVEVISGLKENQEVVISGQINLKEGSKISKTN